MVFLTLNSFTDHAVVVVELVFALGECEVGNFVEESVWDISNIKFLAEQGFEDRPGLFKIRVTIEDTFDPVIGITATATATASTAMVTIATLTMENTTTTTVMPMATMETMAATATLTLADKTMATKTTVNKSSLKMANQSANIVPTQVTCKKSAILEFVITNHVSNLTEQPTIQ